MLQESGSLVLNVEFYRNKPILIDSIVCVMHALHACMIHGSKSGDAIFGWKGRVVLMVEFT